MVSSITKAEPRQRSFLRLGVTSRCPNFGLSIDSTFNFGSSKGVWLVVDLSLGGKESTRSSETKDVHCMRKEDSCAHFAAGVVDLTLERDSTQAVLHHGYGAREGV